MINKIKDILFHIPGWKTNRKIVVIESDDWGMIRMASRKSYDYFKDQGYLVDSCPYSKNDSLESNEDLELLFEILESVSDKNGNPAIITANNVVANPDFEKIKKDRFEIYHFEPFTETLNKYPSTNNVLNLYKEGMQLRLFKPQFHGREHVNINNWLRALQRNDKLSLAAFDHSMFTLRGSSEKSSCRRHYLDAYGKGTNLTIQKESIKEGLDIFEQIHGFRAKSFIAPCYTWTKDLEPTLAKAGISFLQGGRVQKDPVISENRLFRKRYHYCGQMNNNGQLYLVRNASFEMSHNPEKDWVDSCLSQIEFSFRFGKPAIVSSHRVNYMGSIHPENRDNSLIKLKSLLEQIVRKWPDIEFMSSDQLGKVITNQKYILKGGK